MPTKFRITGVSLTLLIGAISLIATFIVGAPTKEPDGTLRQYADKLGFKIGAPIPRRIWEEDPHYRQTLGQQFNAAQSFVFMRITQPEPGHFDFRSMDSDMHFARAHNMKLLGNCLVYRVRFCPQWLIDKMGGRRMDIGAEGLDTILRNQINAVVRHGGDTYYEWEVVDEPLEKNQPWQHVLGRDAYIAKAFEYAHAANPNALLLLNETFGPAGLDRGRVDSFFDLIRKLKSSGVPIDVAGTEMHLQAQLLQPDYVDQFRYFLQSAQKAAVQVNITEMDVYQGPPGFSQHPFDTQKDVYQNIFSACMQDSNCTGFFTWGVSDAHSWLTSRPHDTLPDAAPLLLDRNYNKKPAYYAILEALKKRCAEMR